MSIHMIIHIDPWRPVNSQVNFPLLTFDVTERRCEWRFVPGSEVDSLALPQLNDEQWRLFGKRCIIANQMYTWLIPEGQDRRKWDTPKLAQIVEHIAVYRGDHVVSLPKSRSSRPHDPIIMHAISKNILSLDWLRTYMFAQEIAG